MLIRCFVYTLVAISIFRPACASEKLEQKSRDAAVDHVLVVKNQDSWVSRDLADDYAARRGATHVLAINTPDSAASGQYESITFADYKKNIEDPIRSYLADYPEIDFIILTKGIPIRIIDMPDPSDSPYTIRSISVDSWLAALDYDRIQGTYHVTLDSYFRGHAWANRFWNSTERFSHAKYVGYLVTRLDGYTAADAKALTTRSLEALGALRRNTSPKGIILFNADAKQGRFDGDPGRIISFLGYGGGRYGDANGRMVRVDNYLGFLNDDMYRAADLLRERRIPTEVVERFTGHRSDLAGYYSFGSNDSSFDAEAYRSLMFAPGAIAETIVSTSARTFIGRTDGQSQIPDLIAQGVTGVKGYVNEPFSSSAASPTILFERYTRGWTLAESFYAASPFLGWQDLIIGDPIARAYPTPASAK